MSPLSARFLRLAIAAVAVGASARDVRADLHFKPADHVLGDVHPFFHEGECFLYYLKPGEFRSSLARSRDLLHWREADITHSAVKPGDWMEPWFVLGVFRDPAEGVHRSFYGTRQGRMVSSVSRDLLHWSCASKEFHVPPASYYRRRRDPFVFWIPEMKRYGCVMTTWMKDSGPKETGGALSLATSGDLRKWTDHGAIIHPRDMNEPECPQMFTLGGRCYVLASIHQGQGEKGGVGKPSYWMSTSPLGPWPKKPSGALDGRHNCAAQVAFDGKALLLFGWIPLNPSHAGKKKSWGGHLAIPREIYSLPDGSLACRLPPKLRQRITELPWREVPGFPITSQPREFGAAETGGCRDVATEFTLQMPTTAKAVRVGIAPLGEVVVEHSRIRILDAAGEARSELDADIPAARAVSVRVFVEADMVEVFVNDHHALAARLPARQGVCRLTVRSEGIGASVRAVRISPLEWADP